MLEAIAALGIIYMILEGRRHRRARVRSFVWKCAKGHTVAISEETMIKAIVEPTCPLCGARLESRVGVFGQGAA